MIKFVIKFNIKTAYEKWKNLEVQCKCIIIQLQQDTRHTESKLPITDNSIGMLEVWLNYLQSRCSEDRRREAELSISFKKSAFFFDLRVRIGFLYFFNPWERTSSNP